MDETGISDSQPASVTSIGRNTGAAIAAMVVRRRDQTAKPAANPALANFLPDDSNPCFPPVAFRSRLMKARRHKTTLSAPRPDLVELGKRSFKFGIEESHRIKNFSEGCRCFFPVSLSKGEDAVVSQISHDRRLGNSIADEVA